MTKDESLLNSQDVLNMALGTFISKQMLSILKSSESINFSQIFKLIIIMSLDEVRYGFMNLIKQIFGIIRNNYLIILQYIDKYILKNIFIRTFKYIVNYIFKSNIFKNIKKYQISINLTPTLNFMEKFINYVKRENYKILPNYKINLLENGMIQYTQIWSDIKIFYENIYIIINSELSFTFEKKNEEIKLINFSIYEDNKTELEIDLISNISDEITIYKTFSSFIEKINNE